MRVAGERLPWLSDEPASAASPSAPPPVDRRAGRGMWPWYLLLLLLVAAVAAGAWWLGTRQREAPPPQLPAEQPVAIPVTTTVEQPAPAPAGPAAPIEQEPAAEPTPPAPRIAERPRADARDSLPRAPSGEGEGGRAAVGRSVFPADEPVIERPPVAGPTPVIVYHPNPDRGRVVQLGAFPTRAQADAAWRQVTRRYPYLATKPKMVNTVDVRALGGGRRTRMYRLQLGTSSQAQSVVICQQLEKAGQSCVVVY